MCSPSKTTLLTVASIGDRSSVGTIAAALPIPVSPLADLAKLCASSEVRQRTRAPCPSLSRPHGHSLSRRLLSVQPSPSAAVEDVWAGSALEVLAAGTVAPESDAKWGSALATVTEKSELAARQVRPTRRILCDELRRKLGAIFTMFSRRRTLAS